MPDKSSTTPPPRIANPESSGTGSSQPPNSERIEIAHPGGDLGSSRRSQGRDADTGDPVPLNMGVILCDLPTGQLRMDKICEKATKSIVVALSRKLNYKVLNTDTMVRPEHLRRLIQFWNDDSKKTILELLELLDSCKKVKCLKPKGIIELDALIKLLKTPNF